MICDPSGKGLSGKLTFQRLDADGQPIGPPHTIPIEDGYGSIILPMSDGTGTVRVGYPRPKSPRWRTLWGKLFR